MQARVQAAEAELTRRDREHAAELARIEAAAEARAAVLEEARADLRARAERAERELRPGARWCAATAEGAETGTTAPARRTRRRQSRGVSSGGRARSGRRPRLQQRIAERTRSADTQPRG